MLEDRLNERQELPIHLVVLWSFLHQTIKFVQVRIIAPLVIGMTFHSHADLLECCQIAEIKLFNALLVVRTHDLLRFSDTRPQILLNLFPATNCATQSDDPAVVCSPRRPWL